MRGSVVVLSGAIRLVHEVSNDSRTNNCPKALIQGSQVSMEEETRKN